MDQICSVFSNNYQRNDLIVNEFVCINFGIKLPLVDTEFLKNSLFM